MMVLEMFAWPRPASELKSAVRLRSPVLQRESGKTKLLIVNGLKDVHEVVRNTCWLRELNFSL